MRRILVCTGVLGGGTAVVFALAAITAVAFPQGTLVSAQWNGWAKPMAIELAPVPVEQVVVVDDAAPAIDPGVDSGVAVP